MNCLACMQREAVHIDKVKAGGEFTADAVSDTHAAFVDLALMAGAL